MKAQIIFKVINPDFNKEYADQFNDGKESVGNCRYLWEEKYVVKNIKSFELIKNGTYKLSDLKNEPEFDLLIPNVSLFRCYLDNGAVRDFAVSNSILNKLNHPYNIKYEVIRCYFYINYNPSGKYLAPNLFVNETEISKVNSEIRI